MKININSKSELFQRLIKKLDRQLSAIEAQDYWGKDMMSSNEKIKHEQNVKNIFVDDDFGNIYKPFNQEIVTLLVNDEIKHKQKDK
jgi:hypothetical protein|tara:strand:- start:1081 stop:1338 length:258 start_codon:yes stop_codon:yes gene_type:complete